MRYLRVVVAFVILGLRPCNIAGAQNTIAVLTEPGTPVVAAEFFLSVGPADEEDDQAGIAYLAARTVIEPLRPALDSLGGYVSITPMKDALTISVISAPEVWEQATERVVVALFRERPDSLAAVRERQAIIEEMTGRIANPADAAARAMDRAFFGENHPWGRPTIGTPGSVQTLTFDDVNAFLRANFTPDRAVAAVVGPVDAPDARRHLRPLLGSMFPPPIEVIPYRTAGLPIRRDYNSITTWLTATYRIPETADEESIRFLAYLAAQEIAFSPAQRSVYNVATEVLFRVGQGEMRLQMVVPPEEAGMWEERVEGLMELLIERQMPADVFRGHVRRYYGERLLSLDTPEARAREAARQLFVRGNFESLVPDPAELSLDRIREAARSLETPAIVLLGPAVDDNS